MLIQYVEALNIIDVNLPQHKRHEPWMHAAQHVAAWTLAQNISYKLRKLEARKNSVVQAPCMQKCTSSFEKEFLKEF